MARSALSSTTNFLRDLLGRSRQYVQGRFKPFWFFGAGNHDAMRILISLILLNLFPVLYFITVFFMLSSPAWSIPKGATFELDSDKKYLWQCFCRFWNFRLFRFEIAVIQAWPHRLYGDQELARRRMKNPEDYDAQLARRSLGTGLVYKLLPLYF